MGGLGRSWGVLAASWGVLGGSWSILGVHGSTFVVLSSTRRAEARHLGRFWSSKWDQQGTQNEQKTKTKTKTKKDAFEDRLGAVLGPYWVDLGIHLGSKKCVFPNVFQCFLKINFFEKVRCREATWAELHPIWASKRGPKWNPRGSQDGAKKEKKSEVKLREVSGRQKRVKRSGREVVTSPLGE